MVERLLPATGLGSTYKFVVKDITSHQPRSPRMQLPFLTEMTERTEVIPHVLPVTQHLSQQAIANKRHNVTNYVREYR
jgi:predicted class III extradiol MEMO1 family dioxygenase